MLKPHFTGLRKPLKQLVLFASISALILPVLLSGFLLVQPVQALENNDNLSVTEQHNRTLLYALSRCMDYITPQDGNYDGGIYSGEDVNNYDIYRGRDRRADADSVAVGYEIDPANEGNPACREIDHDRALSFVNLTYEDYRDAIFEPLGNNGNSYRVSMDGKDEIEELIVSRRENRRHSESEAYGPEEYRRRIAVALAQCVETIPEGSLPTSSTAEINGDLYQETSGDDEIPLGHDIDTTGILECSQLIDIANNDASILDSLPDGVTLNSLAAGTGNPQALAQISDGADPSDVASNPGSGERPQSCENDGGDLAWIICPALRMADSFVERMDSVIIAQLSIPQNYYDNDDLRESWSRFRNLALLILVPVLLVMVIGTALGYDFVSAYTVKKSLPRFAFAVVFITLSYDISVFFIRLTEAIGRGMIGFVSSSFGVSDITLSGLFDPGFVDGGLFTTAVLLAIPAGLVFVSIGVMASFALVITVVLFTVFLLLTFRQMLLIALLLVSPLAIIGWIFPSNTKLWSLWRGTFTKLLLLFPVITLMIGVGRVFGELVNQAYGANQDSSLYATTLKLTAYIGPYFLIPFVFKYAGGLFSNIAGMVNDRERGLFDRSRKYRAKKYGENWQKAKDGNRWTNSNFGRRMSRTAQTGTLLSKAGLRGIVSPSTGRAKIRNARTEANMDALSRIPEKDSPFGVIKNDDDLLSAGIAADSADGVRETLRSRYNAKGLDVDDRTLEQNVAAVMAAKQSLGNQFTGAAVVAKAGTKTGYAGRNGHVEMLQDIQRAANGDQILERHLLASAKGNAGNARRTDIAGAGFGTNLDVLNELRQGSTDYDSMSERLADDSLDAQGAGAILGGSKEAAENFVPALQRRVTRSVNNVSAAQANLASVQADTTSTPDDVKAATEARDQARRRAEQDIGSSEALIDVASQASPDVARKIADGLHSAEIDFSDYDDETRDWLAADPSGTRTTETKMDVRNLMKHFGSRPAVDQIRRTYGDSYRQQEQQRRASLGTDGPSATPPTGIGGLGS